MVVLYHNLRYLESYNNKIQAFRKVGGKGNQPSLRFGEKRKDTFLAKKNLAPARTMTQHYNISINI